MALVRSRFEEYYDGKSRTVLLFPIGIFGRKPSTLRSNCLNGYRFYGLLKNPSPRKTSRLKPEARFGRYQGL
jgi:hypothetical protein